MNCERETVDQVCIYAFCGLFSQTVGVRCAFGQTSTIIRLSYGYLSVILRSCLLIVGCKYGILLVWLSLLYGILCAKSEGLFCTRAPHLLLEMYTVHFFGAAVSLHGYHRLSYGVICWSYAEKGGNI